MAIDYSYYVKLSYWTAVEAVALSYGKEPTEFSMRNEANWRAYDAYGRRLTQIHRAIETGHLKARLTPGGHQIKPADFLAWARNVGLEIPPQLSSSMTLPQAIDWEKQSEKLQRELDIKDRKIGELSGALAKTRKWPWGAYDTTLLRKMAQAAERFWVTNYDRSDPTTAPTNKQISDWLKSQGVAQRVAEVMAQILRADGLPPGPRK